MELQPSRAEVGKGAELVILILLELELELQIFSTASHPWFKGNQFSVTNPDCKLLMFISCSEKFYAIVHEFFFGPFFFHSDWLFGLAGQ